MIVSISYSAGGSIVSVDFDASVAEQHAWVNQVTSHPVEKGLPIVDAVRPEVERVTVTAVVTNTPIRPPTSNTSGASMSVSPLELIVPATSELPVSLPGVGAALRGAGAFNRTMAVKAQVLQADTEFDRVSDVIHTLNFLRESATLVTIETSLRSYENFVLQSVTIPRSVGLGGAVEITIEACQLRFVTTRTVPAPAAPVGAKKQNRGHQSTTGVPPERAKSLLAKFTDSFLK